MKRLNQGRDGLKADALSTWSTTDRLRAKSGHQRDLDAVCNGDLVAYPIRTLVITIGAFCLLLT
jgi:hypothetical protein